MTSSGGAPHHICVNLTRHRFGRPFGIFVALLFAFTVGLAPLQACACEVDEVPTPEPSGCCSHEAPAAAPVELPGCCSDCSDVACVSDEAPATVPSPVSFTVEMSAALMPVAIVPVPTRTLEVSPVAVSPPRHVPTYIQLDVLRI